MLDPVHYTIEVPCTREKAFSIFVDEMGSWWPLDQRSISVKNGMAARALRVDSRRGGQIVEISQDGTEYHWGTITSYDPHAFVSMDFHMGFSPENASLVEVRFTALDDALTRVELSQSNWEAFGDMAEMMRNGYGSSWVLIFEQAFKAACGG